MVRMPTMSRVNRYDPRLREQFERTLTPLREQREDDIDPPDVKHTGQQPNDRLADTDPRAGFPNHEQVEPVLAQRLAEAGIANQNIGDKPCCDSEQANDGW